MENHESSIIISVNGKEYTLKPLSIKKLSGAAEFLVGLGRDVKVDDDNSLQSACTALSWLIGGDDSLAVELSRGTQTEIAFGLSKAIQMIDVKDFAMLSTLAKSLERVAANPRP